MEDILVLLEQVTYPVSRQVLIDEARKHELNSASLARLEALEDRTYEDAGDVSNDLVDGRAESNPSIVAINAEVCEKCGFLRTPGEAHSCIEEKARFAESAERVTDEFERLDESAARQKSE